MQLWRVIISSQSNCSASRGLRCFKRQIPSDCSSFCYHPLFLEKKNSESNKEQPQERNDRKGKEYRWQTVKEKEQLLLSTETLRCKSRTGRDSDQWVRWWKGKGWSTPEGERVNSDRKTLISHMSKKLEALILPVHDSQGLSQVMGLQGGYLAGSVCGVLWPDVQKCGLACVSPPHSPLSTLCWLSSRCGWGRS